MPEKSVKTESGPAKAPERVYGVGRKLIGKDYPTPDLYAKVTGLAKYAEDYHADGMLFCKLLLRPLPHARVKHIDTRAALAMPGVKAILMADELPPPADSLTDNGTVIKANPKSERALTMEPLYQGEPILAVAAVDEVTAAEAIEKIKIDFEPLPFVIDPLDTLRPGGPNPRTDGNIWVQSPPPAAPAGAPPPSPPPPTIGELKWTKADFANAKEGQLPLGKTPSEWSFGDVEAGFRNAVLVLDETFVTPDTSHQTLETRSAMAYWQNGKVHVYTGTQSTAQTVPAIARWLNLDPGNVVLISEYTGGGFGSKITGGISLVIPAFLSKKTNTPVMMRISREEETFIGRARPSLMGRMKVGFSKDGRITALDMFVISNNGPYDANGDVPSSGRIVSLFYQPQAMRWRGATILTHTPPPRAQRSPAAQRAKFARWNAGNHDHRTDYRKGGAQTWTRSSRYPEDQLPGRQSAAWSRGARQTGLCHKCIHQGSARPRSGAIQVAGESRADTEAHWHEGPRSRSGGQLLRGRHNRLRWAARHHARWPDPFPVRDRDRKST